MREIRVARLRLCVVVTALVLAAPVVQIPLPHELTPHAAVQLWLAGWMPALVASLAASGLVDLETVIHAFARGHPLWGVATLLVGVTAPAYLIKHVPGLRRELRIAAVVVLVSPLCVVLAMLADALIDPPVL